MTQKNDSETEVNEDSEFDAIIKCVLEDCMIRTVLKDAIIKTVLKDAIIKTCAWEAAQRLPLQQHDQSSSDLSIIGMETAIIIGRHRRYIEVIMLIWIKIGTIDNTYKYHK